MLRPGDVINTENHPKWWKVWEHVLKWGIQRHQKKLGFKNWRHTHTMLYFDDQTILSVTFPKAKWDTWESVRERDYQVYRHVFRSPFSAADLNVMIREADKMIGTYYDAGQLLDIALNRILGYGVDVWHRVFDFGAKLKVCSVGVAAVFERLRKTLGEPWPRLFGGRIIERVAPAHFANSPDFEEVTDA